MRFVTPHQYSQSSKAHLTINTNAVNQMVKFFPPLTAKDKVQEVFLQNVFNGFRKM